jgi:hypothetical protein
MLQIGIISVVVGRPKIFMVVTAHRHPSTTHIPHREIGRVDLRDDLRRPGLSFPTHPLAG